MTRVFVRCDYDAARERLIDKLTRAGFACTTLESSAEEVPAGGHPPLPAAREAGSPPLGGAGCARGQDAEGSPAARESSSPASEGAEAALLCVPKIARGGWAEEALALAERLQAGLVVVVRREDVPAAEQKLRGRGASVFAADVSPATLAGALLAAAKTGERLADAEREIGRLREKLDCERLVARAKAALIAQGMTEGEAHRYIEKTAMDERLPRRAIALRILGER